MTLNQGQRLILVQRERLWWKILKVYVIWVCVFFLFLCFFFVLDDRLLGLARDNGALLVQSMFCKVLLMVSKEEEELAVRLFSLCSCVNKG